MKIAGLLFFLVVLVSCKKEVGVLGPVGPQGPSGPTGTAPLLDTGTITGNTALYDEFSFKENDLSGIIITLQSGSFQQKDTTNSTGSYQFHGIKTDTYNMSFEKPGFGTMKILGLTHIAGGNTSTAVKNIYLLQMPQKTAVDSISLIGNNSFSALFTVTLDTLSFGYVQYYQNFLLYVGKDNTVSNTNYVLKLTSTFTPDGNGGYTAFIDKTTLTNIFQPGDSMYVKAYTYNRYVHFTSDPNIYSDQGDGGFYIDPATGLYVFPNQSGSPNIQSVVY